MTDAVKAGVVGVGSMGRNHARVYRELPSVELVGVADADGDRAATVAADYATRALSPDRLLRSVDAVSIAVPTRFHYEIAREAIERGVDVLIEKPMVVDPERGRALVGLAHDRDVVLQVGHIERFNPAVRALSDIVPDLDVIAVDAMRLGPPVDRDIDVNPVMDLMIHDIDVIRSIAGGEVDAITATRAENDPHVSATVEFDHGVVGTLTASRVTQQKVRQLSITARTCRVNVDYIDQSVTIHRQSLPEYIEKGGDVRFRHQNIVEHQTVENGEPLKNELEAFATASATGDEPLVTGEDGLAALEIAQRISEAAAFERPRTARTEASP